MQQQTAREPTRQMTISMARSISVAFKTPIPPPNKQAPPAKLSNRFVIKGLRILFCFLAGLRPGNGVATKRLNFLRLWRSILEVEPMLHCFTRNNSSLTGIIVSLFRLEFPPCETGVKPASAAAEPAFSYRKFSVFQRIAPFRVFRVSIMRHTSGSDV
jgi:hypothetical protein